VGGARSPRAHRTIRTAQPWDPTLPAVLALVVGSPWTDVWDVVDSVPATPTDVLAHSIAWADFLRELQEDEPVDPTAVRALQQVVRDAFGEDVDVAAAARKAPLTRELRSSLRPFARFVRGA
jgi:hypothetical protein